MFNKSNLLKSSMGIFIFAIIVLFPGCQKDKGHRFPVNDSSNPNSQLFPEITEVNPGFGPLAGGNQVVIKGLNFMDFTEVFFGGTASTGVVVISDMELTSIVPAGSSVGAVDIKVKTSEGEFTLESGYSYQLPEILSINPSRGTIAGGTNVSIIGKWFIDSADNTTVTLGGAPLADIQVISDSLIKGTTVAHDPGDVDVVVQNSLGAGTMIEAFHYIPPPEIESIVPDRGLIAGGFEVKITGSGFGSSPKEVTSLMFGDSEITDFLVNDEGTEITLTAPPIDKPQTIEVKITNEFGEASQEFTYYSGEVTLEMIEPSQGPVTGGTAITLTGTNFTYTEDTAVTLGDKPLLNLNVVSSETITGTTPPGDSPGTITVALVCSNGTASGDFTYLEPIPEPVIESITPASGPPEGGTNVTITGSGFSDDFQELSLCSNAFENINVINDTTIKADTPPGVADETCDLKYVSPGGTANLVDAFTYTKPVEWPEPEISGIQPATGLPEGGTHVTISGSGFSAPLSELSLCGRALQNVSVKDDSTIEATTPAGSEGETCDLVIKTEGGETTFQDAFTYRTPSEFTVEIIFPLCGITTSEAITLEGIIDNPKNLTEVTITNGATDYAAQTSDGFLHFTSTFPLNPGDNSIIVSTKDSFGDVNNQAAALNITRFLEEPVDGPLGIATTSTGDVIYSDYIQHGIFSIGSGTGQTDVVNMPVPAWDIDNNGTVLDAVYIPQLMEIPKNGAPSSVKQRLNNAVFYSLVRENEDSVLCTSMSTQKIWRLTPSQNTADVITDGEFEHGSTLSAPRGLARLEDGTILVSDWAEGTIIGVNAETGERTLVSGAGQGTGPAIIHPEAIALIDQSTLAVASSTEEKILYKVDLASGDRSILSDVSRGSGPLQLSAFDMDVDPVGDLILSDPKTPAIFAVNPGTGDRMTLINGAYGSGPKIKRGQAVFSSEDNIYVVNRNKGELYSIEPGTGNRTLLSGEGAGTGPFVSNAGGIAVKDNAAYITGQSSANVLKVDLSTGNRTIVSGDSTGSGPAFSSPAGIASEAGQSLLVADSGAKAIFRVNLENGGERTIVSDANQGNGPALTDISGVAKFGDFIIAVTLNGSIIKIDPNTGDRQEIQTSGAEPGPLTGIVPLSTGTALLISLDSVSRLEIETGEIQAVSSMSNGKGPAIVRGKAITTDKKGRIFITDIARKTVFQIQLTTGDRVLISR